jgi:hypothetical protein
MNTDKKKNKRGPGRPMKPKGEGKDVIKTVRFKQSELKLFEKAAESKNQDFSEWVREILNRAIQ